MMRDCAELVLTAKQKRFVLCGCDEVLYGGAAGGGKSFAQLADAMIFAMRYPKSRQLILRRTFPELERSLIRSARELFPTEISEYSAKLHSYGFSNGSLIEFGSCEHESDVYKYQSAEYDVIRFDELTHFTEYQYLYLISRVRGTNGYPKQVKSTTNPGGIGHTWVRSRFVDVAPPGCMYGTAGRTRIFIPARISDNSFLMKSDPGYIERLKSLPERERRALLDGDWNITEGRYFPEFDYEKHTCPDIPLPPSWRRYRAIDYGLDRLACLWIAVDDEKEPNFYVYRELCASDMIISDAARAILGATAPEERILKTAAPPDLWSRSQETGRSKAIIFADSGLRLARAGNDREAGWLMLKELMRIGEDGLPRLRIFRSCRELISCLTEIMVDRQHPNDVSGQPHELTHAPDALRYFVSYFRFGSSSASDVGGNASAGGAYDMYGHSSAGTYSGVVGGSCGGACADGYGRVYAPFSGRNWSDDMWQDYYAAPPEVRRELEVKWGK